MSRSGKVRAPWAGERRDFKLGIDQLDELDDICKVGPGHLLSLVSAIGGNWKARQLREVLRLGLIGGGMAPPAAMALVERYFDKEKTPLSDSLSTVQLVLMACVVGSEEDDDVGELGGEGTPTPFPMDASGSAASTRSPAPSDSTTSDQGRCGSSIASTPAGDAPTAPTKRRRARSRTPSAPN